MKKKLVALCAIMLLASGCGKVPKLDNGKDAIVSFKNGDKISVDDFYSKLKDDMGLNTLITMIDTYICETEFKDYKDTASKNAQAYIDAFIEQYGGKDKFLEALQSQTNYQTIDAYQNYLYLANLQSHAIEEYAKTKITDKEIKAYYDDEAIGDMEINHILITADVKDAWEFVLDTIDEELTINYIKKIHFEICKGQGVEPLGEFRDKGVGITGTSYRPKLPSECNYDAELNNIMNIDNDLDRCITLFLWIQKSQMFLDGNKRVANLVANKEMIRNGMGIIAVPVEKIGEYFTELIKFYETNDYTNIKKWIYENCVDGVD